MIRDMKSGLISLFRAKFLGDGPVHPVDRRLAKEWIKKRLVAIFPELRWDPEGLERTYQELNLEMLSEHASSIDPEPLFQMQLPGREIDSQL